MRSTAPACIKFMLPSKALGFAWYTATIQLRVLAAPAAESDPAICESVSPRCTSRVPPGCVLAAGARARDGVAAAAVGGASPDPAELGAAAVRGSRAIEPS